MFIDATNTSFASPFKTRLKHAVDVLIFNPPYVPTDEEEALHAQDIPDIAGAWAGGPIGMQVTNRFLPQVEVSSSPRAKEFLHGLC